MKILLIGNYAPDRQYSMLGFVNALQAGLCERGIEARTLSPHPIAGKLNVPKMGKWLGYTDKLLLFPSELRRAATWADVVHICDQGNAVYTRYLTKKPHLVTCHDLLAIRSALGELADWKTGASGKRFQAMILNGLKRAQYIVCDSRTTYQDLLRIVGTPPAKTSVLPIGLLRDHARLPESQSARLLETVSISPDRPFLLHIGGNQPYKNRKAVLEIFRAFAAFPEGRGISLIMAGKPFTQEMQQYITDHALTNSVRELTTPTDEVISALYSRAEALLFPSLYEGFGLPIIEAQASNCPVFTSNRAPMTEVGSDAALYFDPEQPLQAADVMRKHWDQRSCLQEKGCQNVHRFTTNKMLDGYIETYRQVFQNYAGEA